MELFKRRSRAYVNAGKGTIPHQDSSQKSKGAFVGAVRNSVAQQLVATHRYRGDIPDVFRSLGFAREIDK